MGAAAVLETAPLSHGRTAPVETLPGARRKIHFPGLNALRFLAALTVVLFHAGLATRAAGIERSDVLNRLNPHTGDLAVVFFFVLSGFLITYLLLVEESATGRISVRAFYLRRILRIWPLYYLIVLIALFLVPHAAALGWSASPPDFYRLRNVGFYLVILPNFATPVLYASHLWSIGVEEQFYLCWPVLMRAARRRRIVLFVGFILVGGLALFVLKAYRRAPIVEILLLLLVSRLDSMAIGGLGAWILFRRVGWALRLLYSRTVQAMTFLAIAVLYMRLMRVPAVSNEVYSLLFLIVIINTATNPRALVRIRNRVLENVGEVSYGIYMYHPIVLAAVMNSLCRMTDKRDDATAFAAYLGGVVATIGVAAASYRLLEKPILRQKMRLSPLLTGHLAADRSG